MTIDLIFNRHLKNDFPVVKKKLLNVVGDDDIVLVMEGNQIPVSHKELIAGDMSAFNERYLNDWRGKMLIERNTKFLKFVMQISRAYNLPESETSIHNGLYNLALAKDWAVKHEVTPPDLLFKIQLNHFAWTALPLIHEKDGYVATMRTVLEDQKVLTYKRDEIFINQLKQIESENEKRIVSSRGTLHSYLCVLLNGQGINFHGDLNPEFDDYETSLVSKNLRCEEISDDELAKLYDEKKPG